MEAVVLLMYKIKLIACLRPPTPLRVKKTSNHVTEQAEHDQVSDNVNKSVPLCEERTSCLETTGEQECSTLPS